MVKVHLIEGQVGAGKSTYASGLAQKTGGVHIALDQWFAALFSPDRPAGGFSPQWYIERKERLLDLIWRHSQTLLACDRAVILELGLIIRKDRAAFCRRVQSDGLDLTVHVLDAPPDVRRERVRRRNEQEGSTFAMIVSDEIFDLASRLWEAPDEDECREYDVEFVMNR